MVAKLKTLKHKLKNKKKLGFSERAAAKARGLLKRTGKKNKGKFVKSPKYK
jgi:hypothetical protein